VNETIWTPKLVELRLAEAASVLKRLPEDRRLGYFNTWPQYRHDFADLVEQEPRETSMPPPSPTAISRMEAALEWTFGLEPIEGAIIWMRARNVPWKTICWKVGLQRSAAHENWMYGLCMIALTLNQQRFNRKLSKRRIIELANASKATRSPA
jgi:hypothetical protein